MALKLEMKEQRESLNAQEALTPYSVKGIEPKNTAYAKAC